ncbi:MAG TPA: carbohydrate kinase family protein [Jatrophihabitantaceae bacterium]|nr:carbohydrate kinase family protein [Jatrophihabitantaceae bacterium]
MAVGFDLLVLAELNPDVVVACDDEVRFGQVEQLVDRATITLGSSGAITASAAAAQGLRVALCGVVGDDAVATMTVDLLAAQGVDVSGVVRRSGSATGMTIVLTRTGGDRALLTFPGTMSELRTADLDLEVVASARHVHVSSLFLQRALQPDLGALFSSARAGGATTSIDPGWDPREQWTEVLALLPDVDVFLPNAAECAQIAAATGRAGGDPARVLHELGPSVAVKLGAEGARLVSAEGAWRVSIDPVEPVDTTGAGDNFDAGFLAGLLDGAAPAQALARGVASGTFAVGGWGGTGRLATREEALELAGALIVEQS